MRRWIASPATTAPTSASVPGSGTGVNVRIRKSPSADRDKTKLPGLGGLAKSVGTNVSKVGRPPPASRPTFMEVMPGISKGSFR